MLLLYLPLLIAVSALGRLAPEPIDRYVSLYGGASAEYLPLVLLLASAFGLAFFVASLVKRHPQFQFLLEFIVGLALIVLLPATAR